MTAVLESSLSPANMINDSIEISDFLPRLVECKKEACGGDFEDVKRVSFTLNKMLKGNGNEKFISMGIASLSEATKVCTLGQVPMKAMPFFIGIHSLRHSSLINHWEAWKLRINLWARTVEDTRLMDQEKQAKGLRLEENVVVVIYMHLILIYIILHYLFFSEIRKGFYDWAKYWSVHLQTNLHKKVRLKVTGFWKKIKISTCEIKDVTSHSLEGNLGNKCNDVTAQQDCPDDVVSLQSRIDNFYVN